MANDIDLQNDLAFCEEKLKRARCKKSKEYWRWAIKHATKEILTNYPDLAWK